MTIMITWEIFIKKQENGGLGSGLPANTLKNTSLYLYDLEARKIPIL